MYQKVELFFFEKELAKILNVKLQFLLYICSIIIFVTYENRRAN